MLSFHTQDSVAFVTGTNRKNGIGRAIVEALLAQGARKVYATARKVEQLDELVASHPDKVVPVALDVTDLQAIAGLGTEFPDVTLVVNNAGYFGETSSLLDDIEVAQREIAVNYIAPLSVVKSFAPVLQKNTNTTAVVNVNSIASLVNFPQGGTYSASKAAAHSLTQAQRRDLPNSLVIGVYPGPIDTDMAQNLPWEKTSPSTVAETVISALRGGSVEDIFPDPMAQQLSEGWKTDAKALERQMAQPAEAQPVEVDA